MEEADISSAFVQPEGVARIDLQHERLLADRSAIESITASHTNRLTVIDLYEVNANSLIVLCVYLVRLSNTHRHYDHELRLEPHARRRPGGRGGHRR